MLRVEHGRLISLPPEQFKPQKLAESKLKSLKCLKFMTDNVISQSGDPELDEMVWTNWIRGDGGNYNQPGVRPEDYDMFDVNAEIAKSQQSIGVKRARQDCEFKDGLREPPAKKHKSS